MVEKYYKKFLIFLALILFLIILSILLYFFSPEEIVNKIGIKNAYILAFVVSFFGGFSTLSSITFIATLATLSIGGVNPVILGLVAGTSLAMGDSLIFYIGFKGREIIIGKWEKKLGKISQWTKKRLEKFIPLIAYIYIGFTPFPNDFIILFLAMIKYPFKKLYLPIILGDLTFALLVSVLATKGILIFT